MIDVTPRICTCVPPPGAPELVWMFAPATLPCIACSTLWAGTASMASARMVEMAFARFRRSTPVAWPVITISSSRRRPG